jgi:ATP-dependent exoDNAse (exonuclease V) beta subunit
MTGRPGLPPRNSAVDKEKFDRGEFSVVWWDPRVLKLGAEAPIGIRRPDLIVRDVAPQIVEAGLFAYNEWRKRRDVAAVMGAQSSMAIHTVTESAKIAEPDGQTPAPQAIKVIELARATNRPSGPRFGTLVHAVLASVPLDGELPVIRELATVHGRIIGATAEEIAAAAEAVSNALAHSVLHDARAAAKQNRCRREAPIVWRDSEGFLTEGVVDLAFEQDQCWIVVDFKTDGDLGENEIVYRRQVGLYAAAIEAASGRPVTAMLMRV